MSKKTLRKWCRKLRFCTGRAKKCKCMNDLVLMLCLQPVFSFKFWEDFHLATSFFSFQFSALSLLVNFGKCLRPPFLKIMCELLLLMHDYCWIILQFLLFIKLEKDIKDNYFLKMSMYFISIFKGSKDYDHITTTLTYSDANPRFFLRSFDF